jgi:hypothetical protein
MAEDRSWMYNGWDKVGNYTYELMDKATTFWAVLSRRHRLCGAHVAGDIIQGAWGTRGPLPL